MKSTNTTVAANSIASVDQLEVYHMLASKWAKKVEQSKRPKNKKFKNKY